MRLTARGKVAYVKLEDKISGKQQTDRQTDRQGSVIVYCHCDCIVSTTPSLVLICSKVTQPASSQAGYFEADNYN